MSTLTTLGLALVSVLAAPKIANKLPTSDTVPVLEKAPDGTPVLVLHTLVCAFQDGEPDALPYTAQSPAECEKVTRQTGELRRKAIVALARIAGPAALTEIEALYGAAATDHKLRSACARALVEVGTPAAALRERLHRTETDPEIRGLLAPAPPQRRVP